MNGRILHEKTPARRTAALAFSVFLAKWKEFQDKQKVLTGTERAPAESYVEEFLDYADLATTLDILLRREFAQACLANVKGKEELQAQFDEATRELEALHL